MFKFNRTFFILFIAIFFTEVIIALFVRDRVIRPYGGDVLVVVLMYTFFQSFLNIKPWKIILGVTLFAFIVEIAQYLHIVRLLHLEDVKVARIIIGSSFSYGDLVAYLLGAAVSLLLAKKFFKQN